MKLRLLIYSLICLSTAIGQHLNFYQYSIEHGLPRSGMYAIHQDQHGYLWLGLDGGGVASFDGKEFKSYDMSTGLPSQFVRAVIEDNDGNMWFGTYEGLTKFDHKHFTTFTQANGLIDNYVRTLAVDSEGKLWIGTNGGLSIFDGKSFTNIPPGDTILHKKVRVIQKDHKGRMWVATDLGITIFSGDKIAKLTLLNGLPNESVLDLYEDSKENMWIGTKEGALKVSERDTVLYTPEDGLVSGRIRAICEDRYGQMWFGTRTGISRLSNGTFTTFTEENGLSHERIRDIVRDNQGDLWFATYYGGLNRFSGDDFISYSSKEGVISNQVFSIYQGLEGDIILGTFDGISHLWFDETGIDTIIHFTEEDGLSGDRVYKVFKDSHGRYWYCTNFGVTISDKDQVHYIGPVEGLAGEDVFDIYQESATTFWLGTSEGIVKVNAENIENPKLTHYAEIAGITLPGTEVNAITKDSSGNIWFGFRDGRIIIKNSDDHFTVPKLPKTLERITCMKYYGGKVWAGTSTFGLYSIEPKDGTYKVHGYGTDQGLISNHVYALLFDTDGNLWLGSEKGVDRVVLDADGHIKNVRHYNELDGLRGVEIHEGAAYKDKMGNLWFGTVNGAVYLDAERVEHNQIPPTLHITNISLIGKQVDWVARGYAEKVLKHTQLPDRIRVPYEENSMTIKFTGINLKSPRQVKYKWKLVGYDENWSEPSNRNTVTYTSLPPGSYEFMVMAMNEDGVWTEKPTVLHIEIERPFWLTWWFITLTALALIGLYFLISYFRTRQLRFAKERLEKQVAMATEELRQEKEVVELKNVEIEEQNKSITDSINYAQRIQKAIMRRKKADAPLVKERMFTFYRPKDIVSGDFYWYFDIDNTSFVVAADCTGHGVPGAFMSMIGVTFINQIINQKGITSPDQILFELRKSVVEALSSENNPTKDGMDLALLRIDWDTMLVHYAGANNPLYLVRNAELEEVKADKMPIGHHDLMNEPFQLHTMKLEKDDMLYIFSDGYPDQFGGERGKKFLYSRFKELLSEVSSLPLEEQKKVLISTFDDWSKDEDQIDDILVMGIRI